MLKTLKISVFWDITPCNRTRKEFFVVTALETSNPATSLTAAHPSDRLKIISWNVLKLNASWNQLRNWSKDTCLFRKARLISVFSYVRTWSVYRLNKCTSMVASNPIAPPPPKVKTDQFLQNLWTKWYRSAFSPNTSVSPANSRFIMCSTFINHLPSTLYSLNTDSVVK
jgi:hypothetical protein